MARRYWRGVGENGWMLISFTTDFGLSDGYVAACKGVIAGIAPDVRVLDVSHLIPAGNVRHGAAVLAQTLPYLPSGIHLAVVDPGVGTARRPIAVGCGASALVGPDNGLLLDAAVALGGIDEVREVVRWHASSVSATFHGRDVFAPAAARLAAGADFAEVGPVVDDLVRLPPPRVDVSPGSVGADVVTVDSFGNIQLAARGSALSTMDSPVTITAGKHSLIAAVATTFGDVAPGDAVVHVDSAGYVSVAVNGGSAAETLRHPTFIRITSR
jgi:hypothetical protein